MKTILSILSLLCAGGWLVAQPAPPAMPAMPARPTRTLSTSPSTNPAPAVPAFPPRPSTPSPVGATNAPAVTLPPPPLVIPALTGAPVAPAKPLTNNAPGLVQPAFPALPAAPIRPGVAPANSANPANAAAPGVSALAGDALAAGDPAAADTNVIKAGMIKFQAAKLETVLEIYSELVNRTLLRPAQLPAAEINLTTRTDLKPEEAIRAISTVLAMNGISMVEVGDKFVKVVPEATVFQMAKTTTTDGEVLKMPDMSGFVTVVRQMTNAKPSEVVQALTSFAKIPNAIIPIDSSQILIIRDYADNVKRMLEMLDRIDVMIPMEVEPVVIPIRYALANDIAQVLTGLTQGGGGGSTSIGGSGAGGSSRRGLSGGGGGGGSGFGNRNTGSSGMPGSPGYGASGTGMGGMNSGVGANPGAAQSAFANRLSSLVSKASSQGDFTVIGQAKIIADERTNSLLIFADKRDLAMITNIINKIDVVLAQVLIESLIMEVKVGNTINYGVSYAQKQSSMVGTFSGIGSIVNGKVLNANSFTSQGTNAAAGMANGLNYFGKFGKDLDVTATAVAGDSRVHVLSRPRILTSHAKEASIFIGETRPYVTSTSSGYGSVYGGGYSQYQQMQIGINLSVLPFINADGLVVMDIKQRIQNIGEMVKIDNNDVPTTIDREATAYIAVRDRDTVILGGAITDNKSTTHGGVPLLKDIPFLGPLFRSNSGSDGRGELVVLIRPTVLPTPKDASEATVVEQDNMPDVRRAERESYEVRQKATDAYQKEYEKQLKKEKSKAKKASTKTEN